MAANGLGVRLYRRDERDDFVGVDDDDDCAAPRADASRVQNETANQQSSFCSLARSRCFTLLQRLSRRNENKKITRFNNQHYLIRCRSVEPC